MSSAAEEEDTINVQRCASCGVAGDDDIIKLKDCDDCDLVKYCSDDCQRDHRSQHEEECKQRAAELRDEILFKQSESTHFCDCPICCVPLSLDPLKSTLNPCCSKIICQGCNYANKIREYEGRLQQTCPFCRKALPDTDEEINELLMKRIAANDPVTMSQMGMSRYNKGDYEEAVEYWRKAADLGDADAHYHMSGMYDEGVGVEKDEKMALYHAETAAMEGHPNARHNLALFERRNGRMDRAVKHYIIAAKLGHDRSLEGVKELYKDGFVSKEDFAAALRGYHAAIKATKSPQREEAVAYEKWLESEGGI